MKDLFFLLLIVILLIPSSVFMLPSVVTPAGAFDLALAEGMVAMQVANTDLTTVVLPDEKTPVIPNRICQCNGTKIQKSGDGLISFPCVCMPDCKCKKVNDQGQAAPTSQNDVYSSLYFTATWCGPCQMFHQKDMPVLRKSGWTDADVLEVDVDANPEKFGKYATGNPQLIPYFVITKNGVAVDSKVGYMTHTDFANWYNKTLTDDRAKNAKVH